MAQIRRAAAELTRSTRSENTKRAYAADWAAFSRWCVSAGRNALPATDETLHLFLAAHLAHHSLATAERRTAAVRYFHRTADQPEPFGPLTKELLIGARRRHGGQSHGKAALTVAHIRAIAKLLARRRSDPRAARDRALILLGFASGMRRSELAALRVDDLQFKPRGAVVTIARSKTDQTAQGRQVGIFSGKKATTCPVVALRRWLQLRGKTPGPLFCQIPGGSAVMDQAAPLSGEAINKLIKRAVEAIGVDPAPFGAHSLRAGCITAAAEAGHDALAIMQRTGHRAVQTVARYVRPASVFSRDVMAGAL